MKQLLLLACYLIVAVAILATGCTNNKAADETVGRVAGPIITGTLPETAGDTTPVELGGACTADTECKSTLLCANKICTLKDASECSKDEECGSGFCDTSKDPKICTVAPTKENPPPAKLELGAVCTTDAGCASGLCPKGICVMPDNGACSKNEDCTENSYCDLGQKICVPRKDVGGGCKTNTECESNRCSRSTQKCLEQQSNMLRINTGLNAAPECKVDADCLDRFACGEVTSEGKLDMSVPCPAACEDGACASYSILTGDLVWPAGGAIGAGTESKGTSGVARCAPQQVITAIARPTAEGPLKELGFTCRDMNSVVVNHEPSRQDDGKVVWINPVPKTEYANILPLNREGKDIWAFVGYAAQICKDSGHKALCKFYPIARKFDPETKKISTQPELKYLWFEKNLIMDDLGLARLMRRERSDPTDLASLIAAITSSPFGCAAPERAEEYRQATTLLQKFEPYDYAIGDTSIHVRTCAPNHALVGFQYVAGQDIETIVGLCRKME